MKQHLKFFFNMSSRLFAFTVGMSFILPLSALAASVSLSTSPLVSSTTSAVKPNVMFILDDSGSMDWDYLPDWANDIHPVSTNLTYTSAPELLKNAGFNGVAYNPAITYSPPTYYNADGSSNTSTYPSMTGTSAARGADTSSTPNWKAVPNDGYKIQSSYNSNLVGNASYYVFVPFEYCTNDNLTNCTLATAPTGLYDKAAGLRWCNSSALTTCRNINSSTYKYPRFPGSFPAIGARTSFNVATAGTVTSIKVNGQEILQAPTSGNNTTNTAANIVTMINNCIAEPSGGCAIKGYSATSNNNTVTITAPASLGAITYTPVKTGTFTAAFNAFSGYTASTAFKGGSNTLVDIVSSTSIYTYPGQTERAATRTDCAGSTSPKTCTYAEEMTNYANWWAYYHTRMQSMKSSVSRSFQTLDNKYRVGFSTISETGVTNGAKFLGNNTFELAHKNSWYNKLFAIRVGYFYENPLKGNRQFFTLGAGVKYNVFGLDFAYLIPTQQKNPLENTLRFTLTFDFDAFKAQNEETKTE